MVVDNIKVIILWLSKLIMDERKKTVQPKQMRRREKRIANELEKELLESSDEEIPAPKHVLGPTGFFVFFLLSNRRTQG